jgi:hypothetical protein
LLELQGVVLNLSEVLFYSKVNVNDYEWLSAHYLFYVSFFFTRNKQVIDWQVLKHYVSGVHLSCMLWDMGSLAVKISAFSPVSLAQSAGTLHYICKGPEFEPWSFHLSTLRIKFLTTRLLDKKNIYICIHIVSILVNVWSRSHSSDFKFDILNFGTKIQNLHVF